MLEKAKACLRSGARESLRSTCGVTAHRSKRLVHSSFWNHGAGDLELPGYMISTAPTNLPLKADSSNVERGRNGGKQGVMGGGAGADGVFLDFLYPPQALALMSRMNGPSAERWERRNARRLPDGFVQTSRGYASKACSRQPSKKVGETTAQGEGQGYKRGDAMKTLGLKPVHSKDVSADSGHGKDNAQSRAAADEPDANPEHDAIDTKFGFSPGELAEVTLDHGDRIRRIMQSTRGNRRRGEPGSGRETAEKVLKLYDELKVEEKQDIRFNMELLDWLSDFSGGEVADRCFELFQSIPQDLRSLPAYLSTLDVFLRHNRLKQAFDLVKDALDNIENGDQVAKACFQYALKEQRWHLAINIEGLYRLESRHSSEQVRAERFWFLVSSIPKLLLTALRLQLHLQELGSKKLLTDQTSRFAARFFKEALIQEFQASDGVTDKPIQFRRGFPSFQVGRLFRRMTPWLDDAASFHQEMIAAMISPTCKYAYSDLQRSVYFAYNEVKENFPEHRMPMDILMGLLQRTTEYFDPLVRKQTFLRTLTPLTICEDWIKWYGRLSKDALDRMLSYTAKDGNRDRFEQWLQYLRQHYPAFEDQRDSLWTTVYFHARRNDLKGAKTAFEEFETLAKERGTLPPLKAWNVLIHAYHRVDNLDGGIDLLMDMIDKGVAPSQWSFHPVMEMLAKRGDVEGVQDLLAQYDTLVSDRRPTHFYGSLMNALISSGEVEKVEVMLKELVKGSKVDKTIGGSLTGCFNILLSAHAHRRNVDATMATYRWMKAENIRANGETFAALIHSLAVYRQTNSAYRILRAGMKGAGVQPTAFHYAIVITGYVNEGKYDEALEAHTNMLRRKIKPSLAVNAAYLKAKARKEMQERREARKDHAAFPKGQILKSTMSEFRRLLQSTQDQGAGVAASEPHIHAGLAYQPDQPMASYFSYLITMHGKEQCLEVATRLFEEYRMKLDKKRGSDDATAEVPLQLLISMMSAHHRAGEYDQVEKYWMLAKEQADLLARRVPVPILTKRGNENDQAAYPLQPELMDVEPPAENTDAQEAGFQIALPVKKDEEAKQAKRSRKKKTENALTTTEKKTALFPDSTSTEHGPTPLRAVPGRANILDRPLSWYLYSLSAQSRTQDMLNVVSQTLGQGYTMENRTWNNFIRLLTTCQPPLTLLAFLLAERFLMPSWPGWVNDGRKRPWPPNPSARAQGLEYIRGRYLRPGQLMPRYNTMVHLGAALLRLRRLEVSGELSRIGEHFKDLRKYIGTAKQVREQAPKTVFAVQSMPAVEDRVQNVLLRAGPGSFMR